MNNLSWQFVVITIAALTGITVTSLFHDQASLIVGAITMVYMQVIGIAKAEQNHAAIETVVSKAEIVAKVVKHEALTAASNLSDKVEESNKESKTRDSEKVRLLLEAKRASLLTAKAISENTDITQKIGQAINGRMDQLVESSHSLGHAEGKAEKEANISMAHMVAAEVGDKLADKASEIGDKLAGKIADAVVEKTKDQS